MANYFVYILYATQHDKFYIGQTNSLTQRLVRHNEFDLVNTFTSKYRPWILKAWVDVGEKRSDAVKLERRLKSLKSKKMIAFFAENPDKLTAFATEVLSPDSPPH